MAIIEGARQRAATGWDPASLGPSTNAGAPVNGAGGTLAGMAGKGALLVDTTNARLFINTGTQASPTWTLVGSQV